MTKHKMKDWVAWRKKLSVSMKKRWRQKRENQKKEKHFFVEDDVMVRDKEWLEILLKDDEEVIITGKLLKEYRDVCRKEGALKGYEEILGRINCVEQVGALSLNKYLKLKIKQLKRGLKK